MSGFRSIRHELQEKRQFPGRDNDVARTAVGRFARGFHIRSSALDGAIPGGPLTRG